jgi:hypothetical protein
VRVRVGPSFSDAILVYFLNVPAAQAFAAQFGGTLVIVLGAQSSAPP